jgi:hypothetical protein
MGGLPLPGGSMGPSEMLPPKGRGTGQFPAPDRSAGEKGLGGKGYQTAMDDEG